MIKLKNKSMKLFLGSLVAITPMASVISCSTATELSDSDQELISAATSSTALSILESKWLEQVIEEEVDLNIEALNNQWNEGAVTPLEDIVYETILFHLGAKLTGDANYLKELSNKLLKKVDSNGDAKYATSHTKDNAGMPTYTMLYDVEFLGLKKQYLYGLDDTAFDYLNDELTYTTRGGQIARITRLRAIMNILMAETTLGFRADIYKYILVNEYLTMTFDEWAKLYKDKSTNLSDIERIIDKTANFELIRILLEKKFFAKWEIQLDVNKSAPYLGEENINKTNDDRLATMTALSEFIVPKDASVQPDELMGYSTNVVSDATYTTKKKKMPKSTLDFSHFPDSDASYISRIDNLSGYQGLTSLSSVGKGKLNFSKKGLEAAKDQTYWFGMYQNNGSESNIINNDIKFFGSEKTDQVQMTFVMGLLPLYIGNSNAENDESNEKITLDGTYFGADNGVQALARIIYSQDSSLYNQAFDWFTKKEDDGGKEVLLKVHNKLIRQKYQEMNINYIEYDEDKYK